MTRKLTWGGVAAGIAILFSLAAYPYVRPGGGFAETAWPFPRDGWPAGRAFHCSAVSCGNEIDLYIRPKLGFCNCTTGVADDDEVDRVAALDLISDRFVPLEPGRGAAVAGLAGRIRAYELRMPDGSWRPAFGIAASRRCDLIVAVAVGKTMPGLPQAVLDFLASPRTVEWINAALTGRNGGPS